MITANPPATAFACRAAHAFSLLVAAQLHGQTIASAPVDAATLAKYDKNKNGRLDPEELVAQRADQAKAATAVASRPASVAAEEVIELSPFQVTGAADRGYLAQISPLFDANIRVHRFFLIAKQVGRRKNFDARGFFVCFLDVMRIFKPAYLYHRNRH